MKHLTITICLLVAGSLLAADTVSSASTNGVQVLTPEMRHA